MTSREQIDELMRSRFHALRDGKWEEASYSNNGGGISIANYLCSDKRFMVQEYCRDHTTYTIYEEKTVVTIRS